MYIQKSALLPHIYQRNSRTGYHSQKGRPACITYKRSGYPDYPINITQAYAGQPTKYKPQAQFRKELFI
jgi:hypothetical protein